MTTKKTFEQLSAEDDARKHNGDLSNLVSADKYARDGIKALEAKIEDAKALRAKIADWAARMEKGEEIPYEIMKDIYEQSRKVGGGVFR